MLQVSDAYKELVKSNIRPKCEPIIKVSGIDNTGKEIELVWNAKNIKDLNYKRSIDPVGRELPYMELSWTEIYTGKFNAENYPEKYNNVAEYMAVELSFIQDLGFYNTWKAIFDGGAKWKELFSKTWSQVKNKTTQEVIVMPKLFLEARPTIKGQTITWTARDFLHFCDKPIRNASFGVVEIPFFNPLIGDIYTTANSAQLQLAIEKTWENLEISQITNGYTLSKRIFVDTVFSEFLFNYLKIKNFNILFNLDGSLGVSPLSSISEFEKVEINKTIMYSFPELIKEQSVSNYVFTFTNSKLNEGQNYKLEYSQKYGELYVFEFNGFGEAQEKFNEGASNLTNEFDGLGAIAENVESLVVTPLSFVNKEKTKNIRKYGVDFQERNPINPFSYDIETTEKEPKELDISNLSYGAGYEPEFVSELYDITGNRLYFGEATILIENGLSIEDLNKRGFIVGRNYRVKISFNEAIPILRKIELMPKEIENVEFINARTDFLSRFFSDDNYVIKCEILPMLMLEPYDVVHVDRGLSNLDENGDKQSIITEINIFYNGALKQKMTTHECVVGFG